MNTPSNTTSGGIRAELGEDAAHLGETLKGRAAQQAETGKNAALGIAGSASGALGAAADDLRDNPDAPEWMAKGLQQVARQIDRVAGDLQGRSLEDMTRDAARFARENPGTFLAAAAAAGFAAARLLRAGVDHKHHASEGTGSTGSQYAAQGEPGDGPVWPADENIMPTDTGTDPGFAPAYGAEGGTIR